LRGQYVLSERLFGFGDPAFILLRREKDDRHELAVRQQLGRLDEADAVHDRHGQVGDDQVKLLCLDLFQSVLAVGGSGYYRVTVKDAAGNLLPGVAISASSTETNNAAALLSTVVSNIQASGSAVTSSSAATLGTTSEITAANLSGSNTTKYTCSTTKGGTAKVTVRALVSAATATYVTSDPFAIACGGSLATWSISLDKSKYAPGEIATLTLSGKDSNGFPVGTFTALSGVEYSFGGMTAVTAPTNNDVFSSGIGTKTYQFSVGTTDGAFVGTFKTTGSVDTAAKTLQYTVASPTTGVTNAEVLAAIVKLIASINKQIAALQKALTKKK